MEKINEGRIYLRRFRSSTIRQGLSNLINYGVLVQELFRRCNCPILQSMHGEVKCQLELVLIDTWRDEVHIRTCSD